MAFSPAIVLTCTINEKLPDVVDEAVANELIDMAAQADGAARAVDLQVGYQLPGNSTNADLICRDIVANMRRSVEAVLEIGRGLLVLKQVCAHGDFERRMNEIGVNERLCQACRELFTSLCALARWMDVPLDANDPNTVDVEQLDVDFWKAEGAVFVGPIMCWRREMEAAGFSVHLRHTTMVRGASRRTDDDGR
ncbi:MAG: hypothetical protein LBR95_00450 [Azoarcus sp.]|jgi:hypothetical protein|nr:hypothetical protein [Azoarcus sp.]